MGLTWSPCSPPPISVQVDASVLKWPFDAVIMQNKILTACFWMYRSLCFLHRWRFTFYLYIFTYGVRFLKKVSNLFSLKNRWSMWSSKSFMIGMSIHPLFCIALSLSVSIKHSWVVDRMLSSREHLSFLTALSNRWSVRVFYLLIWDHDYKTQHTRRVILRTAFHRLLRALWSEHADKMKLERCQLWLDFDFICCVVLCAERQHP